MSLNPNQLRTMEDIYADFQTFKDAKDWEQAEAVVDRMKEFGWSEAARMRDELEAARLAE